MTLSNANSVFHQAIARLNQGDIQSAEIILRHNAMHPVESSPTCCGMLLSLLVMQQRMEDAHEIIAIIEDKHQGHDQTDLALGLYYQTIEELPKAKEVYESILKRYPDHPAAQWGLAEVHTTLGNWDKALWYSTQAYHRDPSNLGFAESTIQLLKRTGKQELAQEVAYLACLYHPENEDLFFEAFGVLFETEQVDKAIALLNNFQIASPLSIGWHGIAIEASEGLERAWQFFEEYTPQMGHHPGFLFLKASSFMRGQAFEPCMAIIQDILSIDPGHRRSLELKRSLEQADLTLDLERAQATFQTSGKIEDGFRLLGLTLRSHLMEEAKALLEQLASSTDFDLDAASSYYFIIAVLEHNPEESDRCLKNIPLHLCQATAEELRLCIKGEALELDYLYRMEHRANIWEQHQALQKHYLKEDPLSPEPAGTSEEVNREQEEAP